MVFALETYCAATDGRSAARIEEEVVVTATGCDVITRFPADELLVAGRTYVRGADLLANERRRPARWRAGDRRRGGVLRRRRVCRRSAMTGETGTHELADGRPGYRLVRREDIELADALPGRSRGLTTCRLVDGTLGSTHMALTLVSLVDGHVDEHLHSYETSFYVLEGEPRALPGRARCEARARRVRSAYPWARPMRFVAATARGGSRWPRLVRAPTQATPSSSDRRRTALSPRSTPAIRATTTSSCSRTARWTSICLKRGQAMGAPTVSGSMATAVLAYSGIAVKMLVDQRLDAQLHTMFMVDYQPGACANPHDHPFEESYYMLEGEVDVVADGARYTLRPGDVFWTGTGCVHAFYETQGTPGAVARDVGARTAAAPFVPARAGLELPRGASRLRRRRRCRVSHVSDKPATGVLDDLELYTRIYRQMLLIRGFEDLVQSLFLAGEVYGTTHLYSGQEAIATGVASVLDERDRVAADVPGTRTRARRRRRSAEAARRDARPRRPESTGAGRAR